MVIDNYENERAEAVAEIERLAARIDALLTGRTSYRSVHAPFAPLL